MRKRQTLQTIFFSLGLLVTLFIFYNSSQDAQASSNASGHFVRFFQDILSCFRITGEDSAWLADSLTYLVRKSAHIAEFAAQAVFLSLFFQFGKAPFPSRIIYILFTGLLTACADEFIQLFSVGRASMIQDVFIDFSGVLIGTLAALAVWGMIKRRKEKKARRASTGGC